MAETDLLDRIDAMGRLAAHLYLASSNGLEEFQIATVALFSEINGFDSHELHDMTNEEFRTLMYLQCLLGLSLRRGAERGASETDVLAAWFAAYSGDD